MLNYDGSELPPCPDSNLTDRQWQWVCAWNKFRERNGYPPTMRQWMSLMRCRSPNSVSLLLQVLAKKGWATRRRFASRSVEINPPQTARTATLKDGAFVLVLADGLATPLTEEQGRRLLESLRRGRKRW